MAFALFLKSNLYSMYMNNGFFIRISNNTGDVQYLELFSGQLPDGVIVQTLNGSHDYAAIQKISIDVGFVGNQITSNADQSIQLIIYNDGRSHSVKLEGRFEMPNIRIDGKGNYIKVTCPAHLTFTFRLFAIPDHML